MAFLRNKWIIATLIMLCWAISTSLTTGYYYFLYDDLLGKTRGTTIYVNIGINYGNESVTEWFNGTDAKMGDTLLDVTTRLVTVNGTEYPGMGTLVNSINEIENSYPYYWMWWMWTSYGGWVEGPVACDKYIVGDDETLFWYYEDTSISPLPTPP